LLSEPAEEAALPEVIRAYRKLPLLLQAIELGRLDVASMLLNHGASISVVYRLADGSSSGITPLHSVLMLSDSDDWIQTCFKDVRKIRELAEQNLERLSIVKDNVESSGSELFEEGVSRLPVQ
jgi:hypothetical protein